MRSHTGLVGGILLVWSAMSAWGQAPAPALIGAAREFTLAEPATVAKLIADASTPDGQCAWQTNGAASTRGVRWLFDVGRLKPQTVYSLFAVLKLTVGGDTGDAFAAGVDGPNSDGALPSVSCDVNACRRGEWFTYRIGAFVPRPGQFAYVAGVNNPGSVSDIYVARFFLLAGNVDEAGKPLATTRQYIEVPADWSVVGTPEDCLLHWVPRSSRLDADATASTGKATWQPGDENGQWTVQWHFQQRHFKPGTPYTLFAVLKFHKLGEQGAAVGIGVWDTQQRQHPVPVRVVQAREIKDREWQTFEYGTFEARSGMYFYLTSMKNMANITEFWLDRVYLVPRLLPGQEKDYETWLTEARRLQREAETFIAGFKLSDAPGLERHFAWGMYNEMWEGLTGIATAYGELWQDRFERQLEDMTGRYMNTVAMCNTPVDDNLTTLLELAAKHGFGLCPGSYFVGRYGNTGPLDDAARQSVLDVATRFKGHPGLRFWYIYDEPAVECVYPLLQGKEIIDRLDPEHPAIMTLNTLDNIRVLAPRQQIIFTDHYPVAKTNRDVWAIERWLSSIRTLSAKPIWLVPQTYDVHGDKGHLPTVGEHRAMTYLGLAHGATGFVYYHSNYFPLWMREPSEQAHPVDDFDTPTPIWDEMKRMGKYLTAVGPLLPLARPIETPATVKCGKISVQTEEKPSVLVRAYQPRDLPARLLVAASRNADADEEVSLTAPAGQVLLDLFRLLDRPGETAAPAATLTSRLEPGAGTVLAVGTNAELKPVIEAVLRNRYREELRVYEMELGQAKRQGLAVPPIPAVDDPAAQVVAVEQAREKLAQTVAADPKLGPLQGKLTRIRVRLSAVSDEMEWQANRGEKPPEARVAAIKSLGGRYFAARKQWRCGQTGDLAPALDALLADADKL